ncbi:MAG: beta-propeller domain-containing protein [Candidatus Bathyarchaeia archaeon]
MMTRIFGKVTLSLLLTSLLAAFLPLTFLALTTLAPPRNNQGIIASGRATLLKFSSYEELRTFLNRSWSSSRKVIITSKDPFLAQRVSTYSEATMHTAFDVGYSKTNVQVEGVDEADIVKTDGRCIYLALGERVLIVRAYPPEDAYVTSEIRLNGTILGLFISNGRLIVISINDLEEEEGYREDRKVWSIGPQTSVLVYDVEDSEAPNLIRNVTLSGVYFNSRMIGDYVYVLASSPAYLVNSEPILPEILDGTRIMRVDPAQIYYSNSSDFYNAFTVIAAINIRDPNETIAYETFLFGYASCIYVSLNNIYVAVPKYFESPSTEIHRIRIEGGKITYEASGVVPGTVLNQFSMDEYNGYFRIATMANQEIMAGDLRDQAMITVGTNVYVLNMSLTVIGRLEGLAPGEHMYSARFMGDRCYLVTFKKVDPLFVVSLEDPSNPRVLGKLKIPGYSNYLHPYDERHLIGIGKWTVEAEEGDFAWYQGVKIALFDVSDVEHPKERDSFVIGDRGTESPVLYDHKALLFNRDLDLLAIPVLVAEIDESKYPDGVPPYIYGDYVWQGLYVFNITESSIVLRGRITHISDQEEFLKSGYWFYSEYSIKRALYIDSILYTISNKMIKMNDLVSLEEIGTINLL